MLYNFRKLALNINEDIKISIKIIVLSFAVSPTKENIPK